MKVFITENKILMAVMALILIACFTVIGTRIFVEKENKSYDIVLDYNEMAILAKQTEHDVAWWLGRFAGMGITKVGLTEENLQTLTEDPNMLLTSQLMGNITKEASWKSDYPGEVLSLLEEKGYDPYDILVEMEGQDLVNFVKEALESRFQPEKYVFWNIGEKAYVLVDGTPKMTLYSQQYKHMSSTSGGFVERIDMEGSKIMYISLGLWPEKVKSIQNLGMEIIPRTQSYTGWNDAKYGQAVLEGYARYGIVPAYIIVGGEAVFGFDDDIDLAKDYILDNGITIGLIETTTQLQNIMQYGVEEVAIESGYNTVRVFSVWNYIQYRYQYYGYEGAEEIENTLFRAITERNVRVIYFKPILEYKDLHTYVTDVSVYEKMFENLEQRLGEHNLVNGQASVMADYKVSAPLKVLLGFGAVIGAMLLLRSFFPISRRWSLVLAAAGSVCVPAAFYVMPNTTELIASLALAIVFGCLAVTFYTAGARYFSDKLAKETSVTKILIPAVSTLVISAIIALIGGMMTAAPISSVNYMLEISIFRGVKVGQLLPIAYFMAAYLAYFGYGRHGDNGSYDKEIKRLELLDVKNLLGTNLKVWMVILVAALGGLGVYYIMRTGHESSVEVSSYEMLFRNRLESLLTARPRSKEFLFAFPAIMMMVYASIRRLKLWTALFGICGAIGMVSVINTFEHIRTPLYLGFIRTGYSLLFGIIIGVLGIFVFESAYRLYRLSLEKYAKVRPE